MSCSLRPSSFVLFHSLCSAGTGVNDWWWRYILLFTVLSSQRECLAPLLHRYIYIKNRCFQLLVDSLAHCVQAVLWAPHCADGGLNHLKSTGLPVIGMHHAPNARHHSWTPLCAAAAAAATTTAGRGVAGGGGLKRRWKREVGSQAQKRFDRWRGGGCWRNWSLCRGKDRGVNRRWRRWYCGWNRWWTCDWD